VIVPLVLLGIVAPAIGGPQRRRAQHRLGRRERNPGTAATFRRDDRVVHRARVRLRPRSPLRCGRRAPLERGRGRSPDAAQRELLRAAAGGGLGRSPAAGPRRLGPRRRVLALASGGGDEVTVGIAPGAYRARWSGRNLGAAAEWERLDETAPDSYRLQIWPGPPTAPRAEIKRWSGELRGELGDLPALLDDEELSALAAVAGMERTGDGLRVAVRVAGSDGRSWERTIRADGVVRWVAGSSRFDRVGLHAEHPALLPFADDRGTLSFHGHPDDATRLAHALRAAHVEIAERFVAFEDVVNSLVDLETLLAHGYGQLASGPVTLLRRYAEVADTHGVSTRMVVTGPGRAGLCLLELGETYVVAERFSVA
jgi:hypothetical protein